MNAAIFDGKQITIEDIPPPLLNDNQVLIRVMAVGICGTDLAIFKGNLPTPTPIILGHEIAGDVVALGNDVDPEWQNKRVTTEINCNVCGSCYYCKHDMSTQCIQRKALGIDINGGMAEYIAVEANLLHEVPDSITYRQATFIEPTAAAYQTFELMPLDPEDKNIAIYGMGKLVLLFLQVAKSKKLSIIAIDGSDHKLQLAKKFGAKTIINRHKQLNIPEYIRRITDGIGADIVIDTTGNPEALNDVVASCRTRGKIHMKSTDGLTTPLNITDIVVREITIYSSRCGPFEKAIKGIKNGVIKVDDLISKVFPLDQIQEGFASYDESADHIKTIILLDEKVE